MRIEAVVVRSSRGGVVRLAGQIALQVRRRVQDQAWRRSIDDAADGAARVLLDAPGENRDSPRSLGTT